MNTIKMLTFLHKTNRIFANARYSRLISFSQHHNFSTMSTKLSQVKSQALNRDSFQDVLPEIINTVAAHPKIGNIPDVAKWIKRILDYNLAGGKKNRGLTTVFAYQMLEKPGNINEENMRLARIMGWCVEMLQAYFIIDDDIMDGSTTRRGVQCWYRLPDVGLGAINDSILLYSFMYYVLKKYFGNKSQYAEILTLFNEVTLYTSVGQHLDFSTAHREKNVYSLFTIERYDAIVTHKSGYYTYYLPVALGMRLSNINDEAAFRKVEDLCMVIGRIFQIQDDYIDCFGQESVTGKAGTDIQEGKCTWLAVTALQRCNPAQKALFERNYGSQNPEQVKLIKDLYQELELQRLYKEEEQKCYDEIIRRAKVLSEETGMSSTLFIELINMIYNRNQ